MSNIATLLPTPPGVHRGGRKPGVKNLVTRTLKQCLLLAAEDCVHSAGQGLRGYCVYLATTRPELYVAMLSKLIPQQLKMETTNNGPPRLEPGMNLNEMMVAFEQKIHDPNYFAKPRVIEHDDDSEDEFEQ